MIDYELLCQTIEDWRAGRRPSIDLSPAPVHSGGVEEYADVDADADQDYEGGYEDQGQYGDADPQYEGYDASSGAYQGYEYDGSPAQVATGGTSPVDVSADDVEYDQ
jgi:hypothetical protein